LPRILSGAVRKVYQVLPLLPKVRIAVQLQQNLLKSGTLPIFSASRLPTIKNQKTRLCCKNREFLETDKKSSVKTGWQAFFAAFAPLW